MRSANREDDRWHSELNVEKAHIYAANPGGPWEHDGLGPEELDDFPNIILLCRPHHRRIDGRRRDLYPPQVLQEWKRRREGLGLMVLEGMGRLTEERLHDIFVEANEMLAGRMRLTMDEFAAFDAEAAALLRALIEEPAEARLNAVGLDPDLIIMLSSSSDRLVSLGDYAPMLVQASLALSAFRPAAGPARATGLTRRQVVRMALMQSWAVAAAGLLLGLLAAAGTLTAALTVTSSVTGVATVAVPWPLAGTMVAGVFLTTGVTDVLTTRAALSRSGVAAADPRVILPPRTPAGVASAGPLRAAGASMSRGGS
ncbi:HNH endonuclease signature motif containing protein [Nonomuraea sp. NPDC052129]|uniref:HNH endonuclease signature motif containing protein n=1 Tax=Nonomuraea sp. NPDC052129 TaxID=3154651 RepID=UPI003427B253